MQKSKNQEKKNYQLQQQKIYSFFFALNHISIRSTSVFEYYITQHLNVLNIKTLISFKFFSHTHISSKKMDIYCLSHRYITSSNCVTDKVKNIAHRNKC